MLFLRGLLFKKIFVENGTIVETCSEYGKCEYASSLQVFVAYDS